MSRQPAPKCVQMISRIFKHVNHMRPNTLTHAQTCHTNVPKWALCWREETDQCRLALTVTISEGIISAWTYVCTLFKSDLNTLLLFLKPDIYSIPMYLKTYVGSILHSSPVYLFPRNRRDFSEKSRGLHLDYPFRRFTHVCQTDFSSAR